MRELDPEGLDVTEAPNTSWTVRSFVTLTFQVQVPRQDLSLELLAAPFEGAPGSWDGQRLHLYINGLFQAFHNFRVEERIKVPLLRATLAARANKLQLVLPDAASPKTLGVGEDMRELGLNLSEIVFVAGA
ncbi:MAG TPA: hypothetical protein VGS12_02160 [Caulobacteraceae bacterium]|nr:hypothetical protein [Caulobacteraceae bacterium]